MNPSSSVPISDGGLEALRGGLGGWGFQDPDGRRPGAGDRERRVARAPRHRARVDPTRFGPFVIVVHSDGCAVRVPRRGRRRGGGVLEARGDPRAARGPGRGRAQGGAGGVRSLHVACRVRR